MICFLGEAPGVAVHDFPKRYMVRTERELPGENLSLGYHERGEGVSVT